jgi:hypothetical protein
MEEECIFQDPVASRCLKFEILCHGSISDKKSCPVWGRILVYENYLEDKLMLDREFKQNAIKFD